MKVKTVEINGQKLPIHFGMAALIEISETIGLNSEALLTSLNLNKPKDRLMLAFIGVKHGATKANKALPEAFDFNAFCDLLDERPEAVQEIIGCYYLQTFGKDFDALMKEAEKLEDEKVKKAMEGIKNVWPILTGAASKLVSVDYTK